MVNIVIRLIIFFAAKGGEALYSQQKQDWELTVAQLWTPYCQIHTKWSKSEKDKYHTISLIKKESEITQSCPILCDPMDCRLPDSSVHGIFQAKILEWVAISFSRGFSWPRDRTCISHTAGQGSLYHSYVESKIWREWIYLQNRLIERTDLRLQEEVDAGGTDRLRVWD